MSEELATPPEIPITVVNHKRKKDPEKHYVYIGRGSAYGNPFYMGAEDERDYVCDSYEVYFRERLKTTPGFVEALERLARIARKQGYLKLECFCAPKRCHGDTIAKYVRQLLAEQPQPPIQGTP